jgi:hypothetical protein
MNIFKSRPIYYFCYFKLFHQSGECWRIGFYREGFHNSKELNGKDIKILRYQPDSIPRYTSSYEFDFGQVFKFAGYVTLDELLAVHFADLL